MGDFYGIKPGTIPASPRAAFTNGHLDDVDAEELTKTKMLLLAGIISDQHLDDAGLDEFIAKARAYADELLS